MKALLVRAGIDKKRGRWNAPVDGRWHFVYVPIPEKPEYVFRPGLERLYQEVRQPLQQFAAEHNLDLDQDLRLPNEFSWRAGMHLDPDFEYLTYGDRDTDDGRMQSLDSGDIVVFYSGLRPVHRFPDRLVYALIGMCEVQDVVRAMDVPENRWRENAHTRRTMSCSPDVIVVRGKRGTSGRFDRCIPIGEYRDDAYRVRKDIEDAWGGLDVKDGFIQRNEPPPWLKKPRQFWGWLQNNLQTQGIQLIQANNQELA